MSARAVLKEAADCGLRVRLSSRGKVQFNGKPPADLLAKLRADEAEVIALLRDADSAAKPPTGAETAPALPELHPVKVAAPEPDQAARARLAIDGDVPAVYAMPGPGFNASGLMASRMRGGGRPLMTVAGFSMSGRASLSGSSGSRATCSTCRMTASWAASCGGLPMKRCGLWGRIARSRQAAGSLTGLRGGIG
jgi:hypothetical protein